MAEFGAHLTGTHGSGNESQPPAIFDVLAQENLIHSLLPAIKYALQVLSQKNPTRYGWLYRYSDEIYSSLALLLENHYLQQYSASFAENFYGLKRVASNSRKVGPTQSTELPWRQHCRSLICLVLIPYLRNKCEKVYLELKESRARQNQNIQGWRQSFCRYFLATYPVLHAVWEALILYCQLSYVLDKTKVHSPLLWLAGVHLRNLTLEDLLWQESKSGQLSQATTIKGQLCYMVKRLMGVMAISLSSGLSVSVFFLQFLDWWYASDQHTAILTALPIPPPPKKLECDGIPKLAIICPLCQPIRRNDTALSVSGFVFCYPCIYKYVREHQKCPITHYPARTDHLVKIYQPNT